MADLKKMKKRLLAERDDIRALTQSTKDDRKPVELDQTTIGRLSRVDALQVQAMAQETGRRREIELKRIEGALRRIEEDEYGYCTHCGEEIAPKRLDVDPSAPLCIKCVGN
jgi:DnaK suppressor protein